MPMAEYATSIEIDASPEEVFEYLVTPDGMTAWMGQRADLDPCPDGAFDVDIAGSPIRGRYLEVDRPHRVVVSWGVADSAEFPPGASRVSFTVTPTAHGTRVDLLHSGLPDLMVAGRRRMGPLPAAPPHRRRGRRCRRRRLDAFAAGRRMTEPNRRPA